MKPRALALELTKGCNLRCSYCYYADREDAYQPKQRMSAEVARRSVDLLMQDGPADQPVRLHFFGGEPLLNFELLRDTVLYGNAQAEEHGREIEYEVTTNGTRLSDEVIAFLNEHRVHVGVSFDGPPEVQDEARPAGKASSYQLAAPKIRRLLESRAGTDLEDKCHCSVVVTRMEPDLVLLRTHLEELGFRKILLTPATDLEGRTNGFRDEDLPRVYAEIDRLADAFYERAVEGRPESATWFPTLLQRVIDGERRTHFCQGGRDYLGVDADGELSLCYRFFEQPEYAMGSVQEGIDRDVTERILEQDLESRTACGQCWARWFCGGGCHHDNVTEGGGLGEPNAVTCDLFRHSMGRTLELWGRLWKSGKVKMAVRAAEGEGMSSEDVPEFSAEDRPRSSQTCHVRELGGERVIYDPATHEVVVLNTTAALIFELCDGSRSVDQLLTEMVERFDAPEDVLRQDLEATLVELSAKKLVA